MAAQIKEYFSRSTGFTDAHDELQVAAGNAPWFNQFSASIEGSEERIAEALLRVLHSLAL